MRPGTVGQLGHDGDPRPSPAGPGSRNFRRGKPDKAKIRAIAQRVGQARDTPTGVEGQAKSHPADAGN